MEHDLINNIIEKINKKEELAPFLFLAYPINEVNKKVYELAAKLCEILNVNKNYIFSFQESEWKIKVKDLKDFLENIFITPNFKAQFFIIENIAKMTQESANSSLKIFEETPIWNIIFLTNESEANILDTILSRCTIINLNKWDENIKNEFYYNMIDEYIKNINLALLNYIFKEKIEKEEYIKILKNMILYFKENKIYLNLIWEINEDINWIQNNNFLAKYVLDKYIFKIK